MDFYLNRFFFHYTDFRINKTMINTKTPNLYRSSTNITLSGDFGSYKYVSSIKLILARSTQILLSTYYLAENGFKKNWTDYVPM